MFLSMLLVFGCNKVAEDSLREDQVPAAVHSKKQSLADPLILSSLNNIIQQHDETAKQTRERIRDLVRRRTTDIQWTKRRTSGVSSGGSIRGDLLKAVQKMYDEAELEPSVQKELIQEREMLTLLLSELRSEKAKLYTITADHVMLTNYYVVASKALGLEGEVLTKLLDFYNAEMFIRKGDKAMDYLEVLNDSNGWLLEAMTLWEASKIRLELLSNE